MWKAIHSIILDIWAAAAGSRGGGFLGVETCGRKVSPEKLSLVLERDCPNSMWAMGFGANCLGESYTPLWASKAWLGQVNENVGEISSIERKTFLVIKRADFGAKMHSNLRSKFWKWEFNCYLWQSLKIIERKHLLSWYLCNMPPLLRTSTSMSQNEKVNIFEVFVSVCKCSVTVTFSEMETR